MVEFMTSAVIAIALTPMIGSRLLRQHPPYPPPQAGEGRMAAVGALTRRLDHAGEWAVDAYQASLEWVLRHERATLLVTIATLIATIWLYVIVPKGFLPIQDTGLIKPVTESVP